MECFNQSLNFCFGTKFCSVDGVLQSIRVLFSVFCFGNKGGSVLEWWECFGVRVGVLGREGVLGSDWVVVISASLN